MNNNKKKKEKKKAKTKLIELHNRKYSMAPND
jgi:hypothetical protein